MQSETVLKHQISIYQFEWFMHARDTLFVVLQSRESVWKVSRKWNKKYNTKDHAPLRCIYQSEIVMINNLANYATRRKGHSHLAFRRPCQSAISVVRSLTPPRRWDDRKQLAVDGSISQKIAKTILPAGWDKRWCVLHNMFHAAKIEYCHVPLSFWINAVWPCLEHARTSCYIVQCSQKSGRFRW